MKQTPLAMQQQLFSLQKTIDKIISEQPPAYGKWRGKRIRLGFQLNPGLIKQLDPYMLRKKKLEQRFKEKYPDLWKKLLDVPNYNRSIPVFR